MSFTKHKNKIVHEKVSVVKTNQNSKDILKICFYVICSYVIWYPILREYILMLKGLRIFEKKIGKLFIKK